MSQAATTEQPVGTPEPVLSVGDLAISYTSRGRRTAAVQGVAFSVGPGETVALVGESGSGKTTTAHAIVGLLPGSAHRDAGAIVLGETDIAGWSQRRLATIRGRHVGFVPQDPGVALNPVQRIGVQVAEPLRIHGLAGRAEADARALEILAQAGLDDPQAVALRYSHELSGGQRQRVLIGIALACDPPLIIADEPTSALDVTVQKVVLDHLQERTREAGASVLLITHDLGVAADRADRIIVMQGGRIVEEGPASRVLGAPEHEYTRRLVAAAPSLQSHRLSATPGTPVPRERGDDVVLELAGIARRYVSRAGGRTREVVAARDVNLSVRAGRTTALVGASGSGKTTVARIASRLVEPDAGRVLLGGRDITTATGADLRELRRGLQLVYQDPFGSLDPRMRILDTVAAPLRAYRIGDRASRARAAAGLLDRVQLPADLHRRLPAELSGGQRQRVAIARALALNPRVLILDEPVSALDVSVQEQLLQLLTDLQSELGLGYLFITHDLAVVRQIADEVAVMNKGEVVEAGTVADLFENPHDPYTVELLAAIPGRGLASSATTG